MLNKEVEAQHEKSQEKLIEFFKESKMPVLESETYKFKAIGYLDITESYEKGIVSQTFVNKLKQIWDTGATSMTLGFHTCEFCEGKDKATSSSEKTILDKENKIKYIFPEMLFHYMEAHEFKPSNEFIRFVMNYDEVMASVGGKLKQGMSSAGINISQVFDDELAKLTDKNITDICKNDR